MNRNIGFFSKEKIFKKSLVLPLLEKFSKILTSLTITSFYLFYICYKRYWKRKKIFDLIIYQALFLYKTNRKKAERSYE